MDHVRAREQAAPRGKAIVEHVGIATKSAPLSEPSITIDVFLVRALRAYQDRVNLYIQGYIALEDAQTKCIEAQGMTATDKRDAALVIRLQEVLAGIYEGWRKVPYELQGELPDLREKLERIDDEFTADTSPYMRRLGDDDVERFMVTLRQDLYRTRRAIVAARAGFSQQGLDALRELGECVKTIFNKTEDARFAVEDSLNKSSRYLPSGSIGNNRVVEPGAEAGLRLREH